MAPLTAFASVAPLRRAHASRVENRCGCVMSLSIGDQQRNARLGIEELWAEPPSVRAYVKEGSKKMQQLATGTLDVETSTVPVAVVGDGSPSSRSVLPWDMTSGAQGISYLQQRMALARRRKTMLAKSYDECRRITALFSKTFYMGCTLLTPTKRRAVYAIYAWCRRTDDLVDGPRVQQRSRTLHDVLQDWGQRLDDVFEEGMARDALDLALVDCLTLFPNLSARPFHDMIAGMRMDIEQDRFQTFDDLYLYCYRVAGTVGLMTLPIIGTKAGTRAGLRQAADAAVALGVALQLTNILRDVGEDRLRGRIYIPLEDLERFGYSESDLENCVIDDRYRALMRFQIDRARSYFRKAQEGIEHLAPDARLPVRASLDMYSKILDVLEENDYDNFTKRAYVSKFGKLFTLPLSWMRIQNQPLWHNIASYADKFSQRKSFN